MKEIVILSGKGGTGKTSLTGAFAHLAANHVICDLDVDAPDLHLLLKPVKKSDESFISGHEASIRESDCSQCGQCVELCRFGAISMENDYPVVDPLRCEGCKVCVAFCPESAIDFTERHCGDWYISGTRFGPMVHARLFPGEENSGKLVSLLKTKAREMAEKEGKDLVIADGPPGIGCPVISSLSGASLAVIVTEPTPSGLHDLKRVIELCDHFQVPVQTIINKSDLNAGHTRTIERFCRERNLEILGELPHDSDVTMSMVAGQTVTEFKRNGFSEKIERIWRNIESKAVVENTA